MESNSNHSTTEDVSQTQVDQNQTDPWAAAFAALEQKDKKDSKTDTTGELLGNQDKPGVGQPDGQAASDSQTGNQGGPGTAQIHDGNAGAINDVAHDGNGDQNQTGGLGADSGDDGAQAGEPGEGDHLGLSEQELEDYRNIVVEDLRDRVTQQVNQEFIKQGVMAYNGIVGANINDERITKRDKDGVPHFYNPETGREFGGDNPRAQAQAWCESYNKELESAFNNACHQAEQKALGDEVNELAVLEFAPTYERMDPVRQKLFDNLVSDYEIKDDAGEVVGYSCDLNSAAATVERLVESIQSFAPKPAEGEQAQPQNAPQGPVTDMPNRAVAVTTQPGSPKSIEEALLNYQNNLLNSVK